VISQLGPYLIDEALAEGGMARVFRARLRGLGGFEKTLVLKQIRPELAKDPRFVEMFVREANTLVQMSHPHIVPIYELGSVDGTYYLSMEFIEGATLAQILGDGPLPPALAAQIGVQIGDALDYAHVRVGILHRDITPRNLIVDDAGHTRLLDFGIAAAIDIGAEQFGSPGYMAPEQVRGESLKPASDLFSLGVVLYEAVTGRAPFERIIRGTLATAPSLEEAGVQRDLARIVDRMLRTRVEERPQSAQEVTRALRGWLAQHEPEGVFSELRTRATRARSRVAKESEKAAKSRPGVGGDEPTTVEVEEPRRAPMAPARSHAFATSPVLTQMLRTASGAPTPTPERAASDKDGATRPITRPITRDERPEEPATSARATAFMLRAWPWLGLLALVVAGVLALSHPSDDAGPPAGRHEPTPKDPTPAEPGPTPPTPELETLAPTSMADPPDAGEAARSENEAARALLSVSAVPWAEVSLDGRGIGSTPQRNLRVKSGSHVLLFECPPLGKRARVEIEIAKGGKARVLVDLTTDPPRTSLDGATRAR
jgi:serine/threonine-protein kinase